MTDNPTPNDIALLREALAGAFRLVDGIAGAMNGVPNEPTDDQADVIAGDLSELLGVPFDENWPAAAAAALAPGQHDGAAGEGPVAWCSPGQLANLTDVDKDGGVYLPIRKTERGNFTMPLYAKPAPTEQARAEVEYEVWQADAFGDGDAMVAGSTDLADAQHYAAVYSQDGPSWVVEVTRRPLAAAGDDGERFMAGPCYRKGAAAGDDAVGGGDE